MDVLSVWCGSVNGFKRLLAGEVDLIDKIRKWLYFTKLSKMSALKIRINDSKIAQRLVQEERKACRGFGGVEIKDCETKNMLTLCHGHRK